MGVTAAPAEEYVAAAADPMIDCECARNDAGHQHRGIE
jgi:hypothetical protein